MMLVIFYCSIFIVYEKHCATCIDFSYQRTSINVHLSPRKPRDLNPRSTDRFYRKRLLDFGLLINLFDHLRTHTFLSLFKFRGHGPWFLLSVTGIGPSKQDRFLVGEVLLKCVYGSCNPLTSFDPVAVFDF